MIDYVTDYWIPNNDGDITIGEVKTKTEEICIDNHMKNKKRN